MHSVKNGLDRWILSRASPASNLLLLVFVVVVFFLFLTRHVTVTQFRRCCQGADVFSRTLLPVFLLAQLALKRCVVIVTVFLALTAPRVMTVLSPTHTTPALLQQALALVVSHLLLPALRGMLKQVCLNVTLEILNLLSIHIMLRTEILRQLPRVHTFPNLELCHSMVHADAQDDKDFAISVKNEVSCMFVQTDASSAEQAYLLFVVWGDLLPRPDGLPCSRLVCQRHRPDVGLPVAVCWGRRR